ncbi:MAG: UDP-N-acetylglucosamine 4,6-dehydratase (inverting) [Alphaproteobacteria bacterium]
MGKYAFDNLDFNGRSILVTGGTGSFGQTFIKTVLERYKPKRLIVFSRDESKQFDMANDYGYSPMDTGALPLRFFIGDVRDQSRLEMAMHDVDVVVHAAAMKHVTAAEYNPVECIKTNVHGAENIVAAAFNAGVKKVIALSTDKAVNPVNLYGASKLAADKIFIAANNLAGKRATRFAVVRYGNVLGSRGSVLPYFRGLIDKGAKFLPITDERMTRFWITLPSGVAFVLSCLGMIQGGEVFVPKIPSMRIVDLAKALAPDLPTRVIGIRPGEKLHEMLLTSDESRTTLDFGDRYVVEPSFAFWTRGTYVDAGAKPVPEEYAYTSNGNDHWLDGATLRQMIGAIK